MNHEQVALLAYRLWEERGCPDGSPELDWERAEAMLRESGELASELSSSDTRSMESLERSDSASKESGAQRAAKRRRRDEVGTSGEGSSARRH